MSLFFSFFRCLIPLFCFYLFFFNDTPTTEIYTLSLHDALPIYHQYVCADVRDELHAQRHHPAGVDSLRRYRDRRRRESTRSEEHTSELQSRVDLVCRLLLEKKKKKKNKKVSIV